MFHMAQITNHIFIYLPNYVQCEEARICLKIIYYVYIKYSGGLAFRKDEIHVDFNPPQAGPRQTERAVTLSGSCFTTETSAMKQAAATC